MFDFSWAELMLIGVVVMIFIGPKDFPKVVRWFTDMIKKCRQVAREFHSQFDEMVQDSDLKEAKDQLMQLRHMNVKNIILNTVDQDGSLQGSLNTSLTQTAISPLHENAVPFENREERIIPEHSSEMDDAVEEIPDFEILSQNDPAPGFLPPAIARRLQVKRMAPPVPAMIPPQVSAFKEQRWS